MRLAHLPIRRFRALTDHVRWKEAAEILADPALSRTKGEMREGACVQSARLGGGPDNERKKVDFDCEGAPKEDARWRRGS